MTNTTTARAAIALFAVWMTLWPAALLDAPDWVGMILLAVASVLIGYLAGDATALVLAPRRARRARRRRVRARYGDALKARGVNPRHATLIGHEYELNFPPLRWDDDTQPIQHAPLTLEVATLFRLRDGSEVKLPAADYAREP